jgi:beta-lactam-binding protein with PASTA domain
LPQADAEAAIVAAGLVVGTVTPFPSDTVPAGNGISQSPLVGYLVVPGTEVHLTISSGPEAPVIVSVPSVVGSSQAAAESTIVAAGLTVGNVTTASSDTVAEGNVISQTPAGGTDVEEGTSVDLVVSTGSALVTVPSVVGSSYSTAVAAIENAGLVVGNVSTVRTRRSCGRVNSQTPAGGTNVPAGTAVDLVVTRTRFCNPL